MGSSHKEFKPFRLVALTLAFFLTLFACQISTRLCAYCKRSNDFNPEFSFEQVNFWQLFRYAAYLDYPPSMDACINNLRQIDAAKQQWALDHNAPGDAKPSWKDISPYFGRGTTNNLIPRCKYGGIYAIGFISNAPACTIKGHVLQ
jgi:hypothetical protein